MAGWTGRVGTCAGTGDWGLRGATASVLVIWEGCVPDGSGRPRTTQAGPLAGHGGEAEGSVKPARVLGRGTGDEDGAPELRGKSRASVWSC